MAVKEHTSIKLRLLLERERVGARGGWHPPVGELPACAWNGDCHLLSGAGDDCSGSFGYHRRRLLAGSDDGKALGYLLEGTLQVDGFDNFQILVGCIAPGPYHLPAGVAQRYAVLYQHLLDGVEAERLIS